MFGHIPVPPGHTGESWQPMFLSPQGVLVASTAEILKSELVLTTPASLHFPPSLLARLDRHLNLHWSITHPQWALTTLKLSACSRKHHLNANWDTLSRICCCSPLLLSVVLQELLALSAFSCKDDHLTDMFFSLAPKIFFLSSLYLE